jgi:two-component system sensor histidine kinase KdpD
VARGQAVLERPTRASAAPEERVASSGLTLRALERRRAELWIISIALVASIAVAIAALADGRALLPGMLQLDQLSGWVVAVLIAGMGLAFLLYVWEKERSIRRLTGLLFEERVHSAALSHRVDEMARLSEVGRVVNSALDRRDVLDTILGCALDLLDGTQGAILLAEPGAETLSMVAHRGREGFDPPPAPVDDDGPEATVARTCTPMLVAGDGSVGSSASMVVPLARDDDLLGVLRVSGERHFGRGDLEALGFFAQHAAIAIANSRLLEAERESVARLQELDRLKNDFVATISHELRTPLTAIIGAAKTIARKGVTMDAEHHETFMNIIQRQADRLLRLVQEVLTASRMESDRPRLGRSLVELRDLVEHLIEDFCHTELGARRRIVLHCEPERPQAWADPVAMEQVLSNLIENALKYSASDVDVALSETPSEAVVEVADRGEGMSAEQLATIFDRYRQVEPSSTRSVGGFGLGLFIVKNLVEAQGGTIDVRSEQGIGTRFRIHLPKRATHRQRA